MKCLCPISGMVWEAEGFATGHRRVELMHPIFYSPLENLVAREIDWHANRLSEEEKKLLFLAILNQSDLIDWHHAANPSPQTVEQHFHRMMKLVLWKLGIRSPSLKMPSFSISHATMNMDNFHFWMDAWEHAREDFLSGILKQHRDATKGKLEFWLERRIRSVEIGTQDETYRYLKVLASWGEVAANFPCFSITHPLNKQQIKINEYWKEIICSPKEKVISYPAGDIKEIEEHLIENLDDLSSLYSGALIRRIRRLLSHNVDFYGIELIPIESDSDGDNFNDRRRYSEQLTYDDGTEAAIKAIKETAPADRPVEKDYQSKALFLRAMIAWKMNRS